MSGEKDLAVWKSGSDPCNGATKQPQLIAGGCLSRPFDTFTESLSFNPVTELLSLTLNDDSVALTTSLQVMTTRGDVMIHNGTQNARLPIGGADTFLKSDGTDPAWATITLADDILTTRGDVLFRNASNVSDRLPIGGSGTVLRSDGTDPSWTTLVEADISDIGAHQHSAFDRATSVLAGANVFSDIVVLNGITTAVSTRALTLANLGFTGDANANDYSHPNHSGQVTSTGDGATVVTVSAITDQTALTTGLAGTDELLVSDAGVIKRMDVSVMNAYFEANLNFDTPVINDGNTSTYDQIKTKVVEIGDWDMNVTGADGVALVDVAHGLTGDLWKQIVSVTGVIRSDNDSIYYNVPYHISGGDMEIGVGLFTSTNIRLNMMVGGTFDNSTSFDTDTGYNRGWITITYEDTA